MAEGCLRHEPEVLHISANNEFPERSSSWGFQIVVLRRETHLSRIAESILLDVRFAALPASEGRDSCVRLQIIARRFYSGEGQRPPPQIVDSRAALAI